MQEEQIQINVENTEELMLQSTTFTINTDQIELKIKLLRLHFKTECILTAETRLTLTDSEAPTGSINMASMSGSAAGDAAEYIR